MTIEVAAFRWVPAFAQGYVKDLRVRWALEEAGIPYRVTLIDGQTVRTDAYQRWQPFGQVPAYRDDKVELFESGAIVLHVAATSHALAPLGASGLARTSAWVFAALNTIEPVCRHFLDLVDSDDPVSDDRRARAVAALQLRLTQLSAWLGD
jgi:glutathione S-transferase